MANGWLTYDTVTGLADARGEGDPGFHIALLPGDGQNLEPLIYAQSPYAVQININPINGASRYEDYQNGGYIGDMAGTEMTVSGLAPNTAS